MYGALTGVAVVLTLSTAVLAVCMMWRLAKSRRRHIPSAGQCGVPCSTPSSHTRSTPLMEQPLPAVLNQLVSEFSQHMKQQTATSDELNKFSDTAMKKVGQETDIQRQVRAMHEGSGRRREVC